MLVMTKTVSCIHAVSDAKDIPMDFETCLHEILHPSGLPEWNFCKPLPFAISFMGNVEKRKEGKRQMKRKRGELDEEGDTTATSSPPIAQGLRRSERTTNATSKLTTTADISAFEMVKGVICEYDHHDTTNARKNELSHLVLYALQQHTNGNPNDLWIHPIDIKFTYAGLASSQRPLIQIPSMMCLEETVVRTMTMMLRIMTIMLRMMPIMIK